MLRRIASRRLATFAAIASPLTFSAALAQETVYVAENNLVCVQFESAPLTGSWVLSTSTPGFTEDGYFTWEGPNLFSQPGVAGVFGFDFEVQTGGTYQFRMRNRHEDPDPTEENDVWVRMDGGQWIKTFSNGPGSVGAWTWESRFELHSSFPDATYPLSAGVHRIEFSGRSAGFKMDSFHLFLNGAPGALDPSTPESSRRFGEVYCDGNENSTGQTSVISGFGSPEFDDNDLTLTCTRLPSNQFGIWITSDQPGFTPGFGGTNSNLCISNPGRYTNVISTGNSGVVTLSPDLTNLPRPNGSASAQAGSTWHWQFWHRDTAAAGSADMSRGWRVRLK